MFELTCRHIPNEILKDTEYLFLRKEVQPLIYSRGDFFITRYTMCKYYFETDSDMLLFKLKYSEFFNK